MITPDDEARAVSRLVQRLTAQFPDVPANTVLAIVNASYEQFAGKPIRDFVPVLVERAARDRLSTGSAAASPQQ